MNVPFNNRLVVSSREPRNGTELVLISHILLALTRLAPFLPTVIHNKVLVFYKFQFILGEGLEQDINYCFTMTTKQMHDFHRNSQRGGRIKMKCDIWVEGIKKKDAYFTYWSIYQVFRHCLNNSRYMIILALIVSYHSLLFCFLNDFFAPFLMFPFIPF